MDIIRIRVLRHSAFYSPLLLTIAAGHLQSEGLDPIYEIQTPDKMVVAGLLSGEVDVAQSAVAASFANLEQGKEDDLVHFAQINQRDGFFVTRRMGNTLFDWRDLIGQSVLVDHFFQPRAMFRYALHELDIDERSINIVDAGDVTAIDAKFRRGAGDFVHQQGPAAQQLVKDGLATGYGSVGDIIGSVAFSSLCCRSDWLASDKSQAFMRAYRKGLADAVDLSPGDISLLLKRFFPEVDIAVLETTIADYQRLGCWSEDATISEASYQRLLDVFEYSGLIKQRYAYEQLIQQPMG